VNYVLLRLSPVRPLRLLLAAGLLQAVPVWAVYAPIPEQEQGKEFTLTARVGISHDSNIFGAPTGEISSMVYEFAPKLAYNASLSPQTFLSAAYDLRLDHFDNRPGDKTLDSHDFMARLDHAFSPVTALHVTEDYAIERNPQSLLSGVTLNTDQSYKRNVLDARYVTGLAPRVGTMLKLQLVNYSYDNDVLAFQLDHDENLFGLAFFYDTRPDLKTVIEYRHADVKYDTLGSQKDKHSDFVLTGLDYEVAKRITASARLGYEWRRREGQPDGDAPYIELDLKYNYGEQSYVTAAYVYTYEETSDVFRYNDSQVNRFYVTVQHAFTPLIVGSTSITYAPAELQGRSGLPDVSETTTRVGFALTYLPSKNWEVSATFDYDHVESGDPGRRQHRERGGVSATFTY